MSTEVVPFEQMEKLSIAVAKSNLFGMKTPEQALALMAIAQAEGQHPALAARDYHVVSGRPVLRADAMLARFQAAGGRMAMKEYTDERVVAEFSHPQGGSVTVDWDIERAKRAGLGGRENWKNYPRQMLRARVISEGVRTVFPGAVVGMLTPEEAADTPAPAERDVTPPAPATGTDALKARIARVAEAEVLPKVSLADVDAAFAEAVSLDALDAAADMARSLPEGERDIARKAYAERKRQLEAA